MSGFVLRNQLMTDYPQFGTGGPLQASPLGTVTGTGGLDLAQPAWGVGGLPAQPTPGIDPGWQAAPDIQQSLAAFYQHMQNAGFPGPGVPTMPGQPPGVLAPTAGMPTAQQDPGKVLQQAIDADQANYHGREGGGLV